MIRIFDYWFEGAPKCFKLGAQALLKRKESVEPCLLLLIWVSSHFFTVILKVNIIWLRNLRQVNTLTVVKCKLTCAYLTLFKKLLLKFCNLSSCRSSEHCFCMWCTHVYMRGSVIICEKMPEISAEEDPLTWWRTHETTLPHLVQFAKKYLCISASSSASECVFSALPQDIFVHVKYTSLSCSRLVIFIFK